MQIQKSGGLKYMPGVGPAVPQQCPETGANFLMGGPFWADPIHNMDWVHGILKSVQVRPHPSPGLPFIGPCSRVSKHHALLIHLHHTMTPQLACLPQPLHTQLRYSTLSQCIPTWRITVQCCTCSGERESVKFGAPRGGGRDVSQARRQISFQGSSLV